MSHHTRSIIRRSLALVAFVAVPVPVTLAQQPASSAPAASVVRAHPRQPVGPALIPATPTMTTGDERTQSPSQMVSLPTASLDGFGSQLPGGTSLPGNVTFAPLPSASDMRARIETATTIPGPGSSQPGGFGGQFGAQPRVVEQDLRNRLIDELSERLRARRMRSEAQTTPAHGGVAPGAP